MIIVLCTPKHDYTVRSLTQVAGLELKTLGYHRALGARALAGATYLFTDLDRLNFWELELAARLYRSLRDAGQTVLNDPARVRDRFSLLRALKDRGYNRFDVWRVDEARRPGDEHYPVFLRTQSAHRGNLTDLLPDAGALDAAIADALEAGVPARELMISQYCAEPIRPGLFRKLSVFRVGDRYLTTPAVHESHWTAKYGERGIADDTMYEDELRMVEDNRYAEPLRPAFETAGIDYGRADFCIVDGRPQVYEINTNPMVGAPHTKHPSACRIKSSRLFFERLIEALRRLDGKTTTSPVTISEQTLVAQRRRDRFMLRPRWTP